MLGLQQALDAMEQDICRGILWRPCRGTRRASSAHVRFLSIKDPIDGWRALTQEISKVWPEDVSAVDAIREQRNRSWNK
jgi:hypothetical protein